jgi:inhibitor of KinA
MQIGTDYRYSFSPLGDSAVLIDFGDAIDEGINDAVMLLFQHLKASSPLWVTDLVPAYSSLAVFYDLCLVHRRSPEATAYDQVVHYINKKMRYNVTGQPQNKRQLSVPVCYEESFAPDMETMCDITGLNRKEIISLHTTKPYRVYMIGFLPGFAYMGEVDEALAAPRKKEPRTAIPAGSVGIAGRQTGIYPVSSPGGWQIIGRTPVSLFQKTALNPVFFQPGDEVIFYPISSHEFENYTRGNF